jgi:hypothetical protein
MFPFPPKSRGKAKTNYPYRHRTSVVRHVHMQTAARAASPPSSACVKPRAVLTKEQVIDIFKLSKVSSSGKIRPSAVSVAKDFNVSEKTIRDIWCGRTWHEETLPLDTNRRPRKVVKTGRPLGRKDSAPRRRRTGSNQDRSSALQSSDCERGDVEEDSSSEIESEINSRPDTSAFKSLPCGASEGRIHSNSTVTMQPTPDLTTQNQMREIQTQVCNIGPWILSKDDLRSVRPDLKQYDSIRALPRQNLQEYLFSNQQSTMQPQASWTLPTAPQPFTSQPQGLLSSLLCPSRFQPQAYCDATAAVLPHAGAYNPMLLPPPPPPPQAAGKLSATSPFAHQAMIPPYLLAAAAAAAGSAAVTPAGIYAGRPLAGAAGPPLPVGVSVDVLRSLLGLQQPWPLR